MLKDRFGISTEKMTLAILIRRLPGGGTHTGIIHQSGGTLYELDLQWHNRLNASAMMEHQPCTEPLAEPEAIDSVRAICRLIMRRREEGGNCIPYAIGPGDGSFFDPQDGTYVLGSGLGLTCSSFVLKVFEAGRLPLADLAGWPLRDDDDQRHSDLVEMLRENGAQPDHVERVAAVPRCIRVRPEEVAAAGLAPCLPAQFPELEAGGQWLLSQL